MALDPVIAAVDRGITLGRRCTQSPYRWGTIVKEGRLTDARIVRSH